MTKIEYSINYLNDLYESDDIPWGIAYSGGKDSSVVVELVLSMMKKRKDLNQSLKPVHIISSDTFVEMPEIENLVNTKHTDIKNFAKKFDLPIFSYIVQPSITDTFWTLILGKGYPSPTRDFRWCTSRMKINPTTHLLEDLSKKNMLILLLGVRKEESADRKASIEKRDLSDKGLSIHNDIATVYTSSPIAEWDTGDVWSFLVENNKLWTNHQDMMDLYDKGSGEADCNIALNPESKSCGKTRFGCWTCTVVDKDKSMNGVIKSGMDHLIPLADYRQFLLDIRNDESKRQKVRRNNNFGIGPFLVEARKELLIELLETSKKSGIKLIKEEEIEQIHKYWLADGDLEGVSNIIMDYKDLIDLNKINLNILDKIETSNKDIESLFNTIYTLEVKAKEKSRYGLIGKITDTILKFEERNYLESK